MLLLGVYGKCEDNKAPCDCRGYGKPIWTEVQGDCDFGCLEGDINHTCDDIDTYIKAEH